MGMPDCCRKYYENKILGDGQDLSRKWFKKIHEILAKMAVGLFRFCWTLSERALIFTVITDDY